MATHEIHLIAELQAQLDETKAQLGAVQERLEEISEASWELATALEWVIEDATRAGKMRERVLARVNEAIAVFEEGDESDD
jgi:prefoldin subunit 5